MFETEGIFIIFSDIAFTLGWFFYFSMALKTGSLMWLTFSRRSSSIAKLSSVTIFAKNLLNSSAIAWLSVWKLILQAKVLKIQVKT